MSNDMTTIAVTETQRDALDDLKRDNEAFHHVVGRLLADADDAPADDADADLGELRSSLDTIESRTGRMEQSLEQLTEGRR